MKIITHQAIDQTLCGRPIHLAQGLSRVELETTPQMAADSSGLIHGGFIFGLADYAAMIAVNHPYVVLGAAEVTFLKPIVIGEKVVAEAKVEKIQGKKQRVAVTVTRQDDCIFKGMFTCFVLEDHVLS
jgi:uncharacterized protein (TIGR00369 family)